MAESKSFATGLALLFLALMLAGLGIRFWASEKATMFGGPTHIAAGDEQVFLVAAGNIFHLTRDGELLGVSTPDLTGLMDDPIDLKAVPGRVLLVAEQRPAVVRACNVDSWECEPLGPVAGLPFERQFKVLPGSEPGELLLTDARGDTLWKWGGVGGELQKLVPDGALSGPNGLAFDGDGHLWIADTDHRQIVELLPSDDGTWLTGRRHSARNHLTVGQRFYPMTLARSGDGRWWVTQAAGFSEPYSDLVVYDPEDGAQALIGLPEGAYATDIVSLGDSLLVTDLERYTVYRVMADTLEVSEFGSPAFREQMSRIRESRDAYNRLGQWSLAAIIGFAALMIAAAVRATPKSKRWTQPPVLIDPANAPLETPRTSGIHWLERDPKIDRSLKLTEHLGFAALILMAVSGLALYAFMRIQAGPDAGADVGSKIDELGLILLAGIAILALILPLTRFATRALKRRIGTDGKNLYIRFEDGRELVADPSRLAYTNVMIVYRHYMLPLMWAQQKPLYRDGEVQTWLAPLLRGASKLTQFEAVKYLLKNRF